MATTEPIQITDFDFMEGDDGKTLVVVEMHNSSTEAQTRTLNVVGSSGGNEREGSATVTVSPEIPQSVEVPLGLEFEMFRIRGDLSFDLE